MRLNFLSVLQRSGFAAQKSGSFVAFFLSAVATERVNRLRREAQVSAHRNAALNQEAYSFGGPAAAPQFDHEGASLHQHHGTAQCLISGFAVG